MKKHVMLGVIVLCLFCFCSSPSSVALSAGDISTGQVSLEYRNVTVYAPAVSDSDAGYVGVISTITVTVQGNGSGRVFVDTLPLTDVDMQGSARLAVKVASAFVSSDTRPHLDPRTCDYFFVVRTTAPMIGGPSAGAIMTVAVIALLENWTLDTDTIMTGMINPDGSIGPIGGIPYKIDAAYSVGATRFLIPKGQMTYTEMVIETSSGNGWTQTITRPVTRNVSDYARDNYGMEVYEVADINEALMYFTGWDFPAVEVPNKITTEDYIAAMEPLATSLLDQARLSYENASDAWNTSSYRHWPSSYRNQVIDFLNNAEQRLQESSTWYSAKVYYTSTSKSFQSLIYSRFVSYTCDYFASEDKDAYMQGLIHDAQEFYENVSDIAKNAPITGMVTLQCVGAAQQRVTEAATYITRGNSSYYTGDDLNALYNLAFAQTRSESVHWWLNISAPFNDTGEINASTLRALAEEYLDDAQQAIVYSQIIVGELGGGSSYLLDAQSLLENARSENEKGFSAAALFGAFESLVKANLALELVDGVTLGKVERAKERASTSITASRNQGIEPVLAVSYYEYGQSLANESSLDDAIVYYKYADLIAGAIRLTTAYGTQSSRYVGIPESTPISMWDISSSRYLMVLLFFALIAGVGGLGIGLLIAGLMGHPKQKEKQYSGSSVPRSIEDYDKKKK
ncbi:MAG: hypothetical protein JXA00_02980 [Candidatus Thermoplasmatota archaeon]|nr:hypothetical protein [Candidatus Thermoplasmatota archaeon]